jgi:ferredoxin
MNLMSNIELLADQFGLTYCVDCGKCVAVCPMAEIFDDFTYEVSPRGVIEAVLLDDCVEGLESDRFWFCLSCDLCTDLCPAGVQFRAFMNAIRVSIIEAGVTDFGLFCRNCGRYLWPRHTVKYLQQVLGETTEDHMMLCSTCRQYEFGEHLRSMVPGSRQVLHRRSHSRDD